jgi:hypothetical protein
MGTTQSLDQLNLQTGKGVELLALEHADSVSEVARSLDDLDKSRQERFAEYVE